MAERELLDYYADRASSYDDVYEIPQLQSDFERVESMIREEYAGESVLEVACGTGYWTEVLADVADSVVGIDANVEPIREARGRSYPSPVEFVLGDAYRPPVSDGFSACFAGFWWSHVPLERRAEFLEALRRVLQPGATVGMYDNRLGEGEFGPDVADDRGNTYQVRDNAGTGEYRVLKNFPTEEELTGVLSEYGSDVEYRELDRLWYATYTV